MKISEALLPELDHEMPITRKVLERCPEEKYGWRPHPKSFTMVELASHVANMPGWAAMMFAGNSFDIAPADGTPPPREECAASRKDLLERFDKNCASLRAALTSASDQAMMEPWSLLSGGKPIFTLPRVAVIRTMIMNHGVHHRAQLTVYLRLNDVPVPAVYGPSADEQPM
jgi:uncharacterized damage-inducible protein DinB